MRIKNLLSSIVFGTFALLVVPPAVHAAVTNIVLVSGPTVFNCWLFLMY